MLLLGQYSQLLKLCISEIYFRIKQEVAYSVLKEIQASVQQGSVLGSILYMLYTNDIPDLVHVTIASYADDNAILAIRKNREETAVRLHASVD